MTVLPTLLTGSADCIVTSPPYFGLRDYGHPDQHGLEESPRSTSRRCARSSPSAGGCSRMTALWLNLGDSYYSGRGKPGAQRGRHEAAGTVGMVRPVDRPGQAGGTQEPPRHPVARRLRPAGRRLDSAERDRVAQTEQDAGERQRPARDGAYEHVFLFSKSRRYFFNLDAIRASCRRQHPTAAHTGPIQPRRARGHPAAVGTGGGSQNPSQRGRQMTPPSGRNPGDVWTIPTSPFPEAHYAVMAPAVARRCLLAGCKPGGTVPDPYHGQGTTGMVAGQLRPAIRRDRAESRQPRAVPADADGASRHN